MNFKAIIQTIKGSFKLRFATLSVNIIVVPLQEIIDNVYRMLLNSRVGWSSGASLSRQCNANDDRPAHLGGKK
jgi:hypothetical protein